MRKFIDDAPAQLPALIQQPPAGAMRCRASSTPIRPYLIATCNVVLKHWFCAGHARASPGRATTWSSISDRSRSSWCGRRAGEVRALLNVCRHRGSRLCWATPAGRPPDALTCPYHAWSYDLDGNLLAARLMPASFRRSEMGLKTLPVRVVEGLIFTTFADEPLDFAAAEEALRRSAGVYGWARAKVAHRELYSIAANWKLAVENYMECYHCQPAHPEYAKRHVYARPAEMNVEIERAARRRAEALGIVVPHLDGYGCAAAAGQESISIFRSALSRTDERNRRRPIARKIDGIVFSARTVTRRISTSVP